MADSGKDGPLAPRRTLGGPILPPPPPELARRRSRPRSRRPRRARPRPTRRRSAEAQKVSREERLAARDAEKTRKAEERAQEKADQKAAEGAGAGPQGGAEGCGEGAQVTAPAALVRPAPAAGSGKSAPRRTRRAQLRLVQVDAWSVMKTSFLLSIALGIVLVVAVAIIWAVLGAAGVWDSINSIVQQAVGSDNGTPFDIQEYAGTSRVLGFTMIVAVIDVILITAIATLGAFLYNLAAALLGGIEVTLAEDN